MENNPTPDTGEKEVSWKEVNKIIDKMHDDLAQNMRDMYYNSALTKVETMDQFAAGNFKSGDIVIVGKEKDQTVWLLLHPAGKCLLLAGQETEDVDWFLGFGPIDIIRISQ